MQRSVRQFSEPVAQAAFAGGWSRWVKGCPRRRYSPRAVLKAVVLSNARHCPISPVGPIPGSRAAGELEAHSACRRQLAVVQYIPIGILRLKRSWILSRPRRALGTCRAYRANRHHRCNNGSPESNHNRTPNGCSLRAERSRWLESAALLKAFPSNFFDKDYLRQGLSRYACEKRYPVKNHGRANGKSVCSPLRDPHPHPRTSESRVMSNTSAKVALEK